MNARGEARAIHILVVEDRELDFGFVVRHLRQNGLAAHCQRVDQAGSLGAALAAGGWDLVLSDYRMPGLPFRDVLQRVAAADAGLPVILFSGSVGESEAVDLLKLGVADFVLKDKPARLVPAIERSLREAAERRARQDAEVALRESHEALRAYAARLHAVREEERTRIAREIHDELGQAMTALKMQLRALGSAVGTGGAGVPEQLGGIEALIDGAIQSVHNISWTLRPGVLDTLGLAAAIEWLATDFQRRAGIRCRAGVPQAGLDVGPEMATHVFRICQELLTNVARHARATRADVELAAAEGTLLLEVRDNGVGMPAADPQRPSLGLLGVRERAEHFGGQVCIGAAARGRGTRVRVALPLPPESP